MKKFDIFLAVLVAFAWGSNYIALKYTIIEIPGLLSIALRFTFTAILTLPFVSIPHRTNFRDLYSSALIFGLFHLGLLYYALSLGLNTSLAIIIMQLNIPISVIIARFALKEHFKLSSILGIAIAFVGVIIVVGSTHITTNYLPLLLIFFSAVFCSVFNIQNRKLQSVPPITMLSWINLIAAPHMYIMSYFLEGNPFELLQGTSAILWLSVLYSVLISSLVGTGIWIYLLHKYPVHKVTPFNLLVPFFGVSLSIYMLGDIPSMHIFLGGGIILIGVALSQSRTLPFIVNKNI